MEDYQVVAIIASILRSGHSLDGENDDECVDLAYTFLDESEKLYKYRKSKEVK
jgi:hypothetical protein